MLKETGFKYVIFALNRHNNFFDIAEMCGIMASLGHRAPTGCVGGYMGTIERSWMTTVDAMDAFIKHPAGFALVDRQESFLLISECNKQYAALFYPDFDGAGTGPLTEALGSMHTVSREEAQANPAGWTYRTDTKLWYVAKPENPDSVPPPQGWPTKARQEQIKAYQDTLRLAILRSRSQAEDAGLRNLMGFLTEQYGVS